MARGKRDGLLIVGGGLSGSLAALALAKLRPEVPLLLVEERDHFGGEGRYCFFESEIEEADRWLVESVIERRWDGHYVAFPDLNRKLRIGYACITAEAIDRAVRETLRPDQYLLGTKAVGLRESELMLPGGERIRADGAVDARGPANLSMVKLGWRKILAREYEFERPHRVDLPVLADATIDQVDGYHFAYCLPLSETRLLIEDTYYSMSPEVDRAAVGARIDSYLLLRGWRNGALVGERSGALPIPLSDDVHAFWRGGGARVAKIGARGGFFHPLTGYGLADAVRCATLLAGQRAFEGSALDDVFEREAEQLWKKREFYRAFNLSLFDAPVWERRRIMENVHRLEADVISRFQAGNPTMRDRMRLSGARTGKTGR